MVETPREWVTSAMVVETFIHVDARDLSGCIELAKTPLRIATTAVIDFARVNRLTKRRRAFLIETPKMCGVSTIPVSHSAFVDVQRTVRARPTPLAFTKDDIRGACAGSVMSAEVDVAGRKNGVDLGQTAARGQGKKQEQKDPPLRSLPVMSWWHSFHRMRIRQSFDGMPSLAFLGDAGREKNAVQDSFQERKHSVCCGPTLCPVSSASRR